jgi:hypothetical protein
MGSAFMRFVYSGWVSAAEHPQAAPGSSFRGDRQPTGIQASGRTGQRLGWVESRPRWSRIRFATVTWAMKAIDDLGIAPTPLGICLVRVAQAMSFRPFEGEPVRVELPLRYGGASD